MDVILFWPLPLNMLGNNIQWMIQHNDNRCWPLFRNWALCKFLTAFQIISIECLIIADDLESSQNISIIAVVSGLVVSDPVLLALKADQDKPSWWSVTFSMHSAIYSSRSSFCHSSFYLFLYLEYGLGVL